jgi:chromosome transmission fidelity protein 1
MAQSKEEDRQVTRDFHHPYTPYAIQETFMGTVYQVLEDGKVGILESPSKSAPYPNRD